MKELTVEESNYNIISLKREIKADIIQIIIVFFAAFFLVYKTSPLVRDISFLIFFVLFWRSKKDYFWFAFIFVIINSPAYLFGNSAIEAVYRLPFYSVSRGFTFSFIDLFVILALIKSFYYNNKKINFVILNSLFPFIAISFFIGIFAGIWFGNSLSGFLNNLRPFFYFSILISFSRLIKDRIELIKFGYLILPFILLILFDQLYFVVNKQLFIANFDKDYIGFIVKNTLTGEIRPISTSILLVYFSLFFSFFIQRNKSFEIYPLLSKIVISLAAVIIFLSVTRIWITIFILVFVGQLIIRKKVLETAVILPYFVLLFFGLLVFFNVSDYFFENIWIRYYSFIESLFMNNVTQYDTLSSRINISLPKMMNAILQSPFIGYGFSEKIDYYYNNDLGFFNTILTFGVIGFSAFIISYLYLIKKIIFYIKHSEDTVTKSLLQTLIIVFLGILLGYLTTWDFFSVTDKLKVYFISILIIYAEVFVRYSQDHNKNIQEVEY